MKVAKVALIFTLILFISTAAFSHARASESQTLILRGSIPRLVNYDLASLELSSNYEFYGTVERGDEVLIKNHTQSGKHQIISIITN